MRIAMIGAGYVGLVSAACFAEFGHDVVCVDKDRRRVDGLRAGEVPIFEPGLENLIARNARRGRLVFGTDTAAAVAGADAVFIAVGTPEGPGGGADMSQVRAAAAEVARALNGPSVVVTKSTVPVGTGREVARIIAKAAPRSSVEVASNPEFLREGAAVEDFMRPDRVVIGSDGGRARELLSEAYRPLEEAGVPIVQTGLETAELIKYAANAFLATKITFINEIADLCERLGADVVEVARGLGLDTRIGSRFLRPGPGYGGSCFPKDTQALAAAARAAGAPLDLVETVVEVNRRRKRSMAGRVIDACGGSLEGKRVAVLGLAFKPGTDDMRESPSLEIVAALRAAGAALRVYDPEAMDAARDRFENVTWCEDAYDALGDCDAAVLVTEWPEFRDLDRARMKGAMASPVLVDLRNLFDPAEMRAAGFRYFGIGRGALPGGG